MIITIIATTVPRLFEPEDVEALVFSDADVFEDEFVFDFVGNVLLDVLLFVFVVLDVVLLDIVLLDVLLFVFVTLDVVDVVLFDIVLLEMVLLDMVFDVVVFVVVTWVVDVEFVELVIGGITKNERPTGLNPDAPTNANDVKINNIATIILFSSLFLIYITFILE